MVFYFRSRDEVSKICDSEKVVYEKEYPNYGA